MSILKKIGIISKSGKASDLFESLTPKGKTFETIKCQTAHEYIRFYWNKYLKCQNMDNAIGGKFFEYIIHTLLYREKILPFYTQAKVAFVPNIEFDTILYSAERPLCLSLKTSLRERYKQADLEAIALKYVHRKAESYLLTLDSAATKVANEKIKEGLIIGINQTIDCNTEQIDELVKYLQELSFTKSTTIEVITGNLVEKHDS